MLICLSHRGKKTVKKDKICYIFQLLLQKNFVILKIAGTVPLIEKCRMRTNGAYLQERCIRCARRGALRAYYVNLLVKNWYVS